MGFVRFIRVGATLRLWLHRARAKRQTRQGPVGLGCRTPSMFLGDTAAAPGPAPATGSRAGLHGSGWPGEEEEQALHRARPAPATSLAGHWSQSLAAHCTRAAGTGPMDQLLHPGVSSRCAGSAPSHSLRSTHKVQGPAPSHPSGHTDPGHTAPATLPDTPQGPSCRRSQRRAAMTATTVTSCPCTPRAAGFHPRVAPTPSCCARTGQCTPGMFW